MSYMFIYVTHLVSHHFSNYNKFKENIKYDLKHNVNMVFKQKTFDIHGPQVFGLTFIGYKFACVTLPCSS